MTFVSQDLSELFAYLDELYEHRHCMEPPSQSCIPIDGGHQAEEDIEWYFSRSILPGKSVRLVRACHWCGAASIGNSVIRLGVDSRD